MGIGGFPETNPLSMRWLGMHGAAYANWAVNGEYAYRKVATDPMVKLKDGADLLLSFGVRFDDRVTGKFEEFCKHGTINDRFSQAPKRFNTSAKQSDCSPTSRSEPDERSALPASLLLGGFRDDWKESVTH